MWTTYFSILLEIIHKLPYARFETFDSEFFRWRNFLKWVIVTRILSAT